MRKVLTGELEIESCMDSTGENVCFLVLYDENGNDILVDSIEGFESKKVKIVIEKVV